VSRCRQTVGIGAEKIDFEAGEHITTEYSYKYILSHFYRLAEAAGWENQRTWMDENRWFGIHYFTLGEQ
jgi:uncharacterized SAM-dependent methyltransferase